MRRLDEVEARFGRCNPGTPDINWLVARIRRLEAALAEAKWEHFDIVCEQGVIMPRNPCDCGADAHNAAIDAALKEDP